MQALKTRDVIVTDSFWLSRLAVNAKQAIFHQWEQFEAARCIDNLHLAAGDKAGFREGWFFADSAAYKGWDGANRGYVSL